MPIPLAHLDTRTWTELVAELRAQLPKTAAGWTDHNLHDPGITLLELFAWMSELLLFRLDRISPAMLRAFLRQFGVEPAPPAVAHTVVAVRPVPSTAPLLLPRGTMVTDESGGVRFSSTRPRTVSPAWLELDPTEPTSRGSLQSHAGGSVTDLGAANRQPDHLFRPFGSDPCADDALEIGFDVAPAGHDATLSVYVWTEHWAGDAAEKAGLEAECGPTWWRHPGITTVWEYWTGARGWRPVAEVRDETRGLTLTGPIRLKGLAGHRTGPGDGRYRLRCRLVAGTRECRPRLARVAVNALPVSHAEPVTPGAPLATSRGNAGQSYELGRAPVVAGSLRLAVTGLDGEWAEVRDWDRTGPGDRHALLDPERGIVTFGDGRAGLVPPTGSAIVVSGFLVGGGPAGNVAAGTLTRVTGFPVSAVQAEPATGGASAEPLDRAQGRLLDRLGTAQRGITAADLETLAREVPGVPVARARAIAGYHPGYPCLPVPGAVTVAVLPTCGSPPTRAFVDTVARYLNKRRPMGTELHVTGPTWASVSVRATLHAARNAAPGLADRAGAALDAFFDPRTGGPGGTGWPFGRDVFRGEVSAVLGDLPGVDHVTDLGLSGADGAPPQCANLPLCPTDLVRSLRHTFQIVED